MYVKVPNLRTGYVEVLEQVLAKGARTRPRGRETVELLGVTIHVEDPRDVFPGGVGRGAVPAIAWAEALQAVGGFQAPNLLQRLTPSFGQFMVGEALDDSGAYGCRIRGQLPVLECLLRSDSSTRQAIAMVWDPVRDLHESGTHRSCCAFLQFFIRGGRLEMHTVMRSNDAWWGLAYDAHTFAAIQLTMADALGINPGAYVHHAMSLHLYEENLEAAGSLFDAGGEQQGHWRGGSLWTGSWESTRKDCEALLLAHDLPPATTKRLVIIDPAHPLLRARAVVQKKLGSV